MTTTQTTKRFRPTAPNAFERFNMPTTCGCCGRSGLKRTVKMTDGERCVWMGEGCAKKAAGGARRYDRALAEAEKGRWQSFLDLLCPEFDGRFYEQHALVGIGSTRRMLAWQKTGVVDTLDADEGRAQFSMILDALQIGVDGANHGNTNVQRARFAEHEIDVVLAYARAAFVAWRGEEAANARGVGTRAWYENLKMAVAA